MPPGGSLFRGAALEAPDDPMQAWPAASTAAFNRVRVPGEKTSLNSARDKEPIAGTAPPIPRSMAAVVAGPVRQHRRPQARGSGRACAGSGRVLVRVAASSVNPVDWHFLTRSPYLLRLVGGLTRPRRRIAGVDLAGVVVACGAGVDRVRVGDLVLKAEVLPHRDGLEREQRQLRWRVAQPVAARVPAVRAVLGPLSAVVQAGPYQRLSGTPLFLSCLCL